MFLTLFAPGARLVYAKRTLSKNCTLQRASRLRETHISKIKCRLVYARRYFFDKKCHLTCAKRSLFIPALVAALASPGLTG